jgi:hypothetical protein
MGLYKGVPGVGTKVQDVSIDDGPSSKAKVHATCTNESPWSRNKGALHG